MPVNPIKKKQLLIVLDKEIEERLRAFLLDPAKGYVPRGIQSSFIAEAIKEKLDRADVVLNDFFKGE